MLAGLDFHSIAAHVKRALATSGVTVGSMTVSGALAVSGALTKAGVSVDALDVGTKATFNQTTSPTGWTKSVTHDNKALRVVTGTVGSGGATAFTSVFSAGLTTGLKTLATGEIPAHHHAPSNGANFLTSVAVGTPTGGAPDAGQQVANTADTGGGGSHNHTLSLDLQYVDVIIATKN